MNHFLFFGLRLIPSECSLVWTIYSDLQRASRNTSPSLVTLPRWWWWKILLHEDQGKAYASQLFIFRGTSINHVNRVRGRVYWPNVQRPRGRCIITISWKTWFMDAYFCGFQFLNCKSYFYIEKLTLKLSILSVAFFARYGRLIDLSRFFSHRV